MESPETVTIQRLEQFLAQFAPPVLAEDWDNVGLLVGDPARPARRVMTCLTVTPSSAAEAIRERADLIVTHHPLPFRPLKQLTTHTTTGKLLLQLIESGIAVHSPHTAFDSAARGINQSLAEGLGLTAIRPLVVSAASPAGSEDSAGLAAGVAVGAGRWGILDRPLPLVELAQRVKSFLGVPGLHRVGDPDRPVRTVAVACGSAGQFLPDARRVGCEVLVTGETNFHSCLEAEATGVALLLPGHFASERFAVVQLADILAREFRGCTVWASRSEADPLVWCS